MSPVLWFAAGFGSAVVLGLAFLAWISRNGYCLHMGD